MAGAMVLNNPNVLASGAGDNAGVTGEWDEAIFVKDGECALRIKADTSGATGCSYSVRGRFRPVFTLLDL
jgi:hypothetical protein